MPIAKRTGFGQPIRYRRRCDKRDEIRPLHLVQGRGRSPTASAESGAASAFLVLISRIGDFCQAKPDFRGERMS